ncbi:MAG: sensor domain-containing diguanylate cyclase [Candidatus Sedimenticola sp. PURPLELP]
MNHKINNIDQLHWLLGILQNIDVGLVVLDTEYQVQLWNGFMENHSDRGAASVLGKNIFEAFPDLPEQWLKRKVDSVFLLNNRAFTTWQQRPFLFDFNSYRPITCSADRMYQNLTLFPLLSLDGSVGQVCMIIYDVTDTAIDEQMLHSVNAKLELISRTDGLTRLMNRRAWEEAVEQEFRRSIRSGRSSTLVMLDIDHFKRVNDSFGHQAGDEVLRQVAETLRKTQRDTDLAGRYGGEEFGVLLLDTNIEGASYFCERVRELVEDLAVDHNGQMIHVTISLGISEIPDYMDDYKQWIEHADKALYQSKSEGRNRFTLFQE